MENTFFQGLAYGAVCSRIRIWFCLNNLQDGFCRYYSSSALALSSLLDNTAHVIQTRECDVKGEGPSNIWRGPHGVFFPFLTVTISVKQTDIVWRVGSFPSCFLLCCLVIYRNYINNRWYFSTRTKLLLGEQWGLHSPLFSYPCWTFLQMSRQRSECGLRGERSWVATGRADTVWWFESKWGNTQHG